MAAQFLEASPELAPLFRNEEAAAKVRFQIQVLVDQSASMQGYVNPISVAAPKAAGPTPAKKPKSAAAEPSKVLPSNFFDLLHQMANEDEVSEFVGFGSNSDGSPTTFASYGRTPPLDARQYVRQNNDYADLLTELAKLPPPTGKGARVLMVVTDGVQSHHDEGKGSALGNTVAKLHEWVEKGGAVEMRLLTAPYNGTYYSEELRAKKVKPSTFAGQTGKRPFLVISLLARQADLPAWQKLWERDALSGLKQVAYLRYPALQIPVAGLTLLPEAAIPKDVPVDTLFRNVWDLDKLNTMNGYHDLWRAYVHRVQTQADTAPKTYPGCFVLSGMAPSKDLAGDLRAMNPTLEIWRRVPPAPAKKDPAAGQPTDAAPPATPPAEKWEKERTIDLRDNHNGHVKVTPLAAPASGFRFTATLPVPAKNDDRVVIVTARPWATLPPPPNWKDYSILDDSSPLNLNKIYNLQPFVEQLTSGEVVKSTPVATAVFTFR